MQGYRTILSAVIAAIPALAGLLGFEVAPGFTEEATQTALEIITIAGAIAAVYYRLKATAPGWLVKKEV